MLDRKSPKVLARNNHILTYNAENRIVGVSMSVSGGDFTSWNYDLRGRVTSENKQIPGGGQFITAFTYNLADLPQTMTYPVDNEVVTFNYNNNMLPTSVTGTDTYAQSIAYDSAMRMTQLIRGANKVNSVFTYNAWNADGGRLLNLTSTQVSTSTQLQNSTYDYDSVGNINTITDSLLGPQTQTFTYDNLDRLLSSNVTGGTNGLYSEGYTYNGTTGNLASKNSVNYTYNASHKHAVASAGSNSYGYDANGNMTSRTVGGQSYTLAYDAENRLVSVSGAATASFVYDADGKQVKATVNGVTTYYVGSHYEVKNSVVTKYYFAGATRLAVRTGTTLSYLLSDHLGSSSVTTDANGAKTASALYKAFGETRYTLGALNTDYRFTGQREESALGGIYFFQSRWFDPALGRFMSPDSIVPTGSQGTQAWDRYAFVNNNPVRYNDPTGHMADQGDGGCNSDVPGDCDPPPPTTITVAGVCGSNPDKGPTAPGPNCVTQTDPNDPNTHLEDLDKNAPPGYDVNPVSYPGGATSKMDQANAIAANSPQVLICYSGGVDSCLIYASTTSNSVQAMVLIGGGYYATYPKPGSFITMESGPSPFENGFTGSITNLAGVHILIIYDGNISGTPKISTGGNIQHVRVPENHYTVDDPSSGIWSHVWAWIANPSYQLPYPAP
jgi:RHS repeat-associated protein